MGSIAYSNHDNSATMSKLTAQANRKAISEIASGGCPGAEWPVIVKDLSRKSSDHYALFDGKI